MGAPHVLGITCAGAKSNQVRAKNVATGRDNLQPAKAIRALLRVGMDHVESSRNSGDANPPFACRTANPFREDGIDLLRHALRSSAGEVELDAIEFVRHDGVERLLNRWPDKCLGENAELHQTLPFT